MSGKKKKRIRKSKKKWDITVKVDATFEDILKAGLSFDPKREKAQ